MTSFSSVCRSSCEIPVASELIAHIGEVDQRQLWARYASSMFSYCTEALNLAEHEAYLRIKVARASREHPVLLEMLADGRLHLSGIVVLRPHLTEANRETLLSRAANKTKRQIEELIAELFPKPDVPTTIRKLPERPTKTSPRRSDEQVPEPVPALSSEPEQNNPGVNASLWRCGPASFASCSGQAFRGETTIPGALQNHVYC